jgi:rubrerythrin
MPDFATAFTVKASERILTHNELIRAIRLCMADEFEAIQVYTQLAESTDHPLAKAVLLDIANEEKVHAGEFLHLLSILAPDEGGFYQEGADEVEAQVKKVGVKPLNKGQKETTIGSMKE